MREIIIGFTVSFLLTLIFEFAFCFVWGVHGKTNILLIFLINSMTNPLAVGICYYFNSTYAVMLPVEAAVAVVEAVYLTKYGKDIKHPALLAVLMNTFSFSAGLLIKYL